MSSIPARINRLAKTLQAADMDYIYDPDHTRRPTHGGPWYKTPRGWSTVRPATPPQTDDKAVRAKDPHTPPDELRALTNDDRTAVVISALGNPSMPVDILNQFADGDWMPGREAVAGNSSTPPDTLTKILHSRIEHGVAEQLARNPSSPPTVLRAISRISPKMYPAFKDAADIASRHLADLQNRRH